MNESGNAVLSYSLAQSGKSAQSGMMTEQDEIQAQFFNELGDQRSAENLFDQISDTVYFVKDRAGRYMSVNQTLVERCGRASKQELIGRTAREVFPELLGTQISAQDQSVLEGAATVRGTLELHLYAGGREDWCLTWKEPLLGTEGKIIGLSGVSRDLQPHSNTRRDFDQLAAVLKHIEANISRPLRLPDLAELAGLSTYQLDNRVRTLFGITAGQYITRARIDLARNQLKQSDDPISRIALECGYSDQAAFSRQFRQSAGLSPAAYRKNLDQKT